MFPSSVTMTVVPTAVRPVSVGREFSTSEPSAGDSMLGGGGVTSEMVTATGAAGSETFPARSADPNRPGRWTGAPASGRLGGASRARDRTISSRAGPFGGRLGVRRVGG